MLFYPYMKAAVIVSVNKKTFLSESGFVMRYHIRAFVLKK